jgi:hypothetical protein
MQSEPILDSKTSVSQRFLNMLASVNDPAFLVVAQKAIDDLLSVYSDGNQQISALRTLEEELILVLRFSSGERFDLANELIDARLRTIRVSQKGTKQPAAVRPSDEDMFEKEQPQLRSVA